MKTQVKRTLTLGLSCVAVATFLVLLTGAGRGFPTQLNDFLRNLTAKLQAYTEHMPEDRVYLQFDKPFYKPGEDVWFSAYVRDGASMKASQKSDILHVELINPKGNVQKAIQLVAHDGFAKGDFQIDAEYPGGLYKVRAFTKWQDNEKEAFVFEKELQVQKVVLPNLKMKLDFERKAYGKGDPVTANLDLQSNANQPLSNHKFRYKVSLEGNSIFEQNGTTDASGKANLNFDLPKGLSTSDGLLNVLIEYEGLTESISRAIPIQLNQIDLALYPEGGDLVEGLRSRLAFRARNEFDKPADVEGIIVDDQGNTVANFNSYHQGMGAFDFRPEADRAYTAQITRPTGIDQTFELPTALPRGYVLSVAHNDTKELGLVVRSTEQEALSLVAQVRGEVYWASEVTVAGGEAKIGIPLADLPNGTCQVTLFDSKGIERCERLVFVNRDRQLNIDVRTEKEKYQPREKVKMTVKVTDERGMPMPANLSMSVVNDQLLSFADDKSGNILSQLLLEPDLKQKVEEPAFYFKKDEEKSLTALDHLMMTSGWRRFVWEEVLTDRLPVLSHAGERAILGGQVLDGYSGQPIPYASITAGKANIGVQTDKEGRFTIDNLDLGLDNVLSVEAEGYATQQQTVASYIPNLRFNLYNPNAIGGWDDWAEDDADGAVAMDFEMAEEAPVRALNDVQVLAQAAPPPPKMARAEVVRADKAQPKRKLRNKAIPMPEEVVEQKEVNRPVPVEGIEKEEKLAERQQQGFPGQEQAPEMDLKNFDQLAVAGNVEDNRFGLLMARDTIAMMNGIAGPQFYRAREFEEPTYTSTVTPAKRTDFRSTIYWNPSIKVDRSGKAELEFYASDEITSFRATVEGIAKDGAVGHQEHVFYTQLPFSMSARVPVEVATNDYLVVPVVLKNNTTRALTGSLHIIPPSGLRAIKTSGENLTLTANSTKAIDLVYEVLQQPGESKFEIAFASQGHTDAFEQPLKIVPQGFPVNISFAGREKDSAYKFRVNKLIPGSASAQLTAYPSVVSDLVKGIESILREPYGCFEQTSTSSYPNALVMQYMIETDNVDPVVMERARTLLDKGYKRLATFECSSNGYEWFGSNPPHEALTAYGLMQFSDYGSVYKGVDQKMVDRTANWLMSRRDGKGGFKKDPKALDSFGRASAEVTNAYIAYALSEAGFKDIQAEAKAAYDAAISSKDPYQLALVANTMFNLDKAAQARTALEALLATQAEDGSFTGKKHSITYSQGQSLKVETTSLAVLAMLKAKSPNPAKLQEAVQFITSARSGHGSFGSTQATIMALKSLVGYTKFAKQTDESGIIEVYVDGKKLAEKAYAAGTRDAIVIDGLGNHLNNGNHDIQVKFKNCKNALPYSIAVDYFTSLPNSSPECVVELSTKLASKKTHMGETVRLSATLQNTTEEGQPMTMAILGLPAGLSAQPWQLKEMQEKSVFDFYEIVGNNVVCYYRQMKPSEKREINLDLKADIPGRYTAPASAAYLYYTAEHKNWTSLPQIEILN